MTASKRLKLRPFGEASCEAERKVYNETLYQRRYFNDAPFNDEASSPQTFLIVGRRGSGKTSLAQYLSFQKDCPAEYYVDVDEPDVYEQVIRRLASAVSHDSIIAVPRLARVWKHIIWSLIFNEYRHKSPDIAAAAKVFADRNKASSLIRKIIKALLNKYLDDSTGELSDSLEDYLETELFRRAREAVLTLSGEEPVIIAMDTLEKYDVNNDDMMCATAALIECASDINARYSHLGIHLKVFLPGELFPYLVEGPVSNTGKFIRNEIFLHWRPRDLVRLVCYRLMDYLANSGFVDQTRTIDWTDYDAVLGQAWRPYFGTALENRAGRIEDSLPYVLRHTQMRPRQLVTLCNHIADLAIERGCFPRLYEDNCIQDAIHARETMLATSVINSYSSIYPGASQILDALSEIPAIFTGNLLDRLAKTTAGAWPTGEYGMARFRTLVCELGIVGRVRHRDERTGIVAADFSYAMEDRLRIQTNTECVMHPMFYRKFSVQNDDRVVVLPFPDRPEFRESGVYARESREGG